MSTSNSTVSYRELSSIIGIEGYRVGDDGGVWSCRKRVWVKGTRGCRSVISDEWVQLKSNEHDGYRRITFPDGKRKLVHDLVLLAFVGPAPTGLVCCHGNGIRHDNRLENLRWGTGKENTADMMTHGTHFRASGELNGEAKVTEEQVLSMRAKYAAREASQYQLADEFGLSQGAVWSIVNRVTWTHI